jgi:hypothetical protein
MRKGTALLAIALLAGLASPATASDATVKASLVRGVAQIRGTHDAKRLQRQLRRTLASIRSDRGSTAAGRTGRRLALRGFAATLEGVQAQLDFSNNDSGNIEAAIRDAKAADRYLNKGARLLRAAGRSFGLRFGRINNR